MLLPPCGQLLRPPAVRIRWLSPSILCSLPAEESNRVYRRVIVYKDSWFDLLAINHLSNSLQAATGLRINKSGYDGLVETVITTSRLFSPAEQRRLVLQSLDMAFPGIILLLIKNLVPPSKFTRQFFALFTTIFFRWLVGPCEVKESELGGIIQRNVVHITKCRVLEETNCVGVCTNLCKMPSQAFIKDSLGMPVNMIPNFVDMSCEMIFGQEPPPESSDPAFSQPCYKICKVRPKAHEDKQLHRAEKVIRPDQG